MNVNYGWTAQDELSDTVPISSVFRLYYVVYIKFIFIFSVSDIAAYLFYNLVSVFAAENIFLAGI